jgi:hypothetical protein
LVGDKFNTNIEGGKKIVDNYFMITGGQVYSQQRGFLFSKT